MAREIDFDEMEGGPLRRWAVYAVLLFVVLGLVFYVYRSMTALHGVKVEAPSPTVVDMLPPPPPPPPPPPQPTPKPPEPTNNPTPAPSPEPPKAPSAPAPVTINGPAQAGADSFGVQSGTGSGVGAPGGTGTCLGANCGTGGGVGDGGVSEGFYRRYLSNALQQRVQDDDKLNRLVFTADFTITITADGRVTGVTLAKSSGKSDRDQELKAILESVSGLNPPPPSVHFPQRISVRGRRSI